MRVLICGDTHAQFSDLALFFGEDSDVQIDLALVCGDFGFWPRYGVFAKRLFVLKPPFPIYFCDGNHEDHHALNNLRWGGQYGAPRPEGWNQPPRVYRIGQNVFWQERGSTLTLPDGRVVLFAGGAFSTDYEGRYDGITWFKSEELLTERDLARFPDSKVDIVVSHTCPERFLAPLLGSMAQWELPDPSRIVLDKVFERYRPRMWFFGHWHVRKSGQHEGCEWHALGPLDGDSPVGDGMLVLE